METQLQIKNLASWDLAENQKPLIIAGPCSAETEEQILQSAKELKQIGITIFRAGIWKPRTRPNTFEGVGNIGLKWMKTVKKETGMLLSTEVANVKHVYESLKAGIDILWIGARTTANPFAVQEIADALKGVDIPVLVKNPVNPDTDLWIGAIERFLSSGLTKIGAIHRGFSSAEKSIYRNTPLWKIPIELKTRIPDIPLFCDPSHIAGNRELLQDLSQKAIDLSFDGLMIESHPDPNKAWSDAKQQITASNLKSLQENLVIREEKPEGISLETIEDLRFKIDQCDNELIDILETRMKLAESIGLYKKQNNMTILQTSRWETIINSIIDKGSKKNLTKDFVLNIFKSIHQESINKQTIVINDR
jgi:chorismate mutase